MELKLGSIPITIQWRFFLMALMLGLYERDPVKLAIWIVVVFFSVVIHELGHALMGMAFGLVPSIELHGMGGRTSFAAGKRSSIGTGRSIAISVAGPLAGFVFVALLFVAQIAGLNPTHPLAITALRLLFVANAVWGVFNLLPMLPLDGGNVLRAILNAASKTRGEMIARVVSILVASAIVLWAVSGQQWWILYLGALFAFQNVQALRQAGQMRVDQTLVDAIQESHRALDRHDPKAAISVLQPALATAATAELRQAGIEVYVVALMRDARFHDALDVLTRERTIVAPSDLERYAGMMRELGHEAEALRIDELGRAPLPLHEFRT